MNRTLTPDNLRLQHLVAEQWQRPLTPTIYSNILKHQIQHSEIENDNENLIWLFTLMLLDGIELPEGEVISAMKQRLLDEDGLTPIAWRYIANGTAEDFRVVIDAEEPSDAQNWRWKYLIYWLQILSGLRLKSPIPATIQYLFLHDSMIVMPELDEVQFRGAWMSFGTLRHIIKEAIKQLDTGTLERFIDNELVEVITWLSTINPELDNNQTKKGWKFLVRKSAEWKADIVMKATYRGLRWDSALPEFHIDDWTIVPIVDAWSLHRLAITQRHCGDSFIDGCINGSERIFVINNQAGKITATLRLTNVNGEWSVGDIKGFANSDVPKEVSNLGDSVFQCYSKQINMYLTGNASSGVVAKFT
jgi:hypothetical protein